MSELDQKLPSGFVILHAEVGVQLKCVECGQEFRAGFDWNWRLGPITCPNCGEAYEVLITVDKTERGKKELAFMQKLKNDLNFIDVTNRLAPFAGYAWEEIITDITNFREDIISVCFSHLRRDKK